VCEAVVVGYICGRTLLVFIGHRFWWLSLVVGIFCFCVGLLWVLWWVVANFDCCYTGLLGVMLFGVVLLF